MAKTRRKAAYQKQRYNKLSMVAITLVVLMMLIFVSIRSVGLKQKLEEKNAELDSLNKQYTAEEQRTAEIEAFGKEVQTKGYIEEMAREKLGLTYEGEIIFKEDTDN